MLTKKHQPFWHLNKGIAQKELKKASINKKIPLFISKYIVNNFSNLQYIEKITK